MEQEYGIRHYVVFILFMLVVIGSWILVIGHQFDLGALNLARRESLDGVVIFAYLMTAVTVAVIGARLLSSWLKT